MKTRYKKTNVKGKWKRKTKRGGRDIMKNIDKSLGSTRGQRMMLASSKLYKNLTKETRVEPNEFLRKIKSYADFAISMDRRDDAQMDNSVEIDESLRIIQEKINSIPKTNEIKNIIMGLTNTYNDPIIKRLVYLYEDLSLQSKMNYFFVDEDLQVPYNINLSKIKKFTKQYLAGQHCPPHVGQVSREIIVCDNPQEEISDLDFLILLYCIKYNLELARFSIREHKDKTKNFVLENREEAVVLPQDLIAEIIPPVNYVKYDDFGDTIRKFVNASNTQYEKLSKTYQTIDNENEGIKQKNNDAKEQLDMEDALRNLSQLRKQMANPTDLNDSSRSVTDKIHVLIEEKTKLNSLINGIKTHLSKPDTVEEAKTKYERALKNYESKLYATTGKEPKLEKKYTPVQIIEEKTKKEKAFQNFKRAKEDEPKIEEEEKEKEGLRRSIKSIEDQIKYIDQIIEILRKQPENKPATEEEEKKEEEIDLSAESADYTMFYYLSLWDSRIKKCEQENRTDCNRDDFNQLIAQISHDLTEILIVQVFHEINLYYEHNKSNTKPLYKFLKAYADKKNVSDDLHAFLEEENSDYLKAAELKDTEKGVESDIHNFSKSFVDMIINNTTNNIADIKKSANKLTVGILYPENTIQVQAGGGDNSAITIKKIIAYLLSDDVTNQINLAGKSDEEKEQMNKKRDIVIDTLKKQVSHNYFDYDIDNIFDSFFPKAFSADDLNLNKQSDKIIETNGKIKTFMYSYPVDQETLDKKGDKSKQENNPFGIQMSVFRRDPKNIELSEILGIEMWLAILNMSGANTNYIQDYYYKDNKPDPMYVNEINVKERKKNPFVLDL